jgi:hypothetical protein
MSMAWVRKSYRVPAKRGGRVEYSGDGKREFGTIVSASGGRLNIRLDGIRHTMPFHPTWALRYLSTDKASIHPTSGTDRGGNG